MYGSDERACCLARIQEASAAAFGASLVVESLFAMTHATSHPTPSGSPTALPASELTQRLQQLRIAMQGQGIDACIVPSSDPHLSEYLPAHWQGREHFSGFTGSVGTLVVTREFAGLWVDSRYWGQAEKELAPAGVTLMKIASAAVTSYIDWLAQDLAAGQTVAVDGNVLSLATGRALAMALAAKNIKLNTTLDAIDSVWQARPALPRQAVFEHAAPYCVVNRAAKLAQLRAAMHAKGAHRHFISTLDDVAWLLNLRGADVSYNPVFVAHVLVGADTATLFIDAAKVPTEVVQALRQDGVQLAPYAHAAAALAALPAGECLWLDPRRVTYGFRQAVAEAVSVTEGINFSTLQKSIKTPEETAYIRQTMTQDGVALCEFFSWLDQALAQPTAGTALTELTIDAQITAARARQQGFVSASFGTIAGFNANGAMPHYRATAASHAAIEGHGLLLIDSGGQYLGGTTDITRMVPIGQVTAAQKRDATLVLKGMVALSRVQFPMGSLSPHLEALARAPIWAAGVDYAHGTGHGVGYFLNVHEGPQSISRYTLAEPHTAMLPGMVTSNEPGIYRPGQWGVRIENLMLTVAGPRTEFGEFLCFETLTMCPIDTRCLEASLLSPDELAWLNGYHRTVRERLLPHVQGAAKDWLLDRTEALLAAV